MRMISSVTLIARHPLGRSIFQILIPHCSFPRCYWNAQFLISLSCKKKLILFSKHGMSVAHDRHLTCYSQNPYFCLPFSWIQTWWDQSCMVDWSLIWSWTWCPCDVAACLRVHCQGDDRGAGTETDAPWYVFTTNIIYLADWLHLWPPASSLTGACKLF